jgi:hypothetical protein
VLPQIRLGNQKSYSRYQRQRPRRKKRSARFERLEARLTLDNQLTAYIEPATFSEGGGARAATLWVQWANPDGVTSPARIQFQSSDVSEVTVQPEVTFPIEYSRVGVYVQAVDDLIADGTQSVEIVVSAPGYATTVVSVKVTDNEPASWQNPLWNRDVTDDDLVTPRDALVIINWLNRGNASLPASFDNTFYYDVNNDGQVTPMDALNVINWMNTSHTSPSVSVGLWNDTGASGSDLYTREPGLSFEVQTNISEIRVRLNHGPVVQVVPNATGKYIYNPVGSEIPDDGIVRGRVAVRDAQGGVTVATTQFQLDRTPPTATLNLARTSDSQGINDQATSHAVVTLVGQTEGLATVSSAAQGWVSQATHGGFFQLTQVPLAVGRNTLAYLVTDLAGNTATATAVFDRVTTALPDDPVRKWNAQVLESIRLDSSSATVASRVLALTHLAIYDIVNGIERAPSWIVPFPAPANTLAEAAIGSAAHHILTAVYAGQATRLDAFLANVLSTMPASHERAASVLYGTEVAKAYLQLYPIDRWNEIIAYEGDEAVGRWRPTAPGFEVASVPLWGELETFSQLTTEPLETLDGPPAVGTAEYAAAFAEVKRLGRSNSTERTVEQTEIARFWADGSGTYTPPGHWNDIASNLANSRGLSLTESARLFAQLNATLSDIAVAVWKAKYAYQFWRPITAIQNGMDDRNAATIGDAQWWPLLLTPSFPEYVSGHSAFSGGAAQVLAKYFGDATPFTTRSIGLPGVERNFNSFTAAAEEAGRSRIYGGIHFEFSNAGGRSLGLLAADLVESRLANSIDSTPPRLFFSDPVQTSKSALVRFTGWGVDDVSGIAKLTVSIDNGFPRSIPLSASGQFELTHSFVGDGTDDGVHTFSFLATDHAGYTSEPVVLEYRLDTRVPTLNLDTPPDNSLLSASARLMGTVQGTGSEITQLTYRWDQGRSQTMLMNRASGSFEQMLDVSTLQPGPHVLEVIASDAAGNTAMVMRRVTVATQPLLLSGFTPSEGEFNVGVTFRPQLHFSRPIVSTTLTTENFYATDSTGAKLDGSVVASADGRLAWLFFPRPLPSGSLLTVTVNGDTIRASDGTALDADGNGTEGGVFRYSLLTVNATPLAGTSIRGKVIDPGPDLKPMTFDDLRPGADGVAFTADDIYLNVLRNAKVFVLGMEDAPVFTDANGDFFLPSVPTGNVKLAIDGMTVTNAPAGYYFPEMVLDLEILPNRENTVMGSMGSRETRETHKTRPEVYLPRVAQSILRPTSNTSSTRITADRTAAPQLTAQQRALVQLVVPPAASVGLDGETRSDALVGMSTVPPELVRDMLPPGLLQHTLDITIQSPGTAVFTRPLELTLPNLFREPPGTKLNFLSFDHTTGRLVIEGTATVSSDGLSVTTDVGTGITKPGWHGVTSAGSQLRSRAGIPCFNGENQDRGEAMLDGLVELTSNSFAASRKIVNAFDDLVTTAGIDTEDVPIGGIFGPISRGLGHFFQALKLYEFAEDALKVLYGETPQERVDGLASVILTLAPAGRIKNLMQVLTYIKDYVQLKQKLNTARDNVLAARDLPPCSSINPNTFSPLVNRAIQSFDRTFQESERVIGPLQELLNNIDRLYPIMSKVNPAVAGGGLTPTERQQVETAAEEVTRNARVITNTTPQDPGFDGTVADLNQVTNAITVPSTWSGGAGSGGGSNGVPGNVNCPLYWAAEIGGNVIRGRVARSELISGFAPPRQWVRLVIYDPLTNRIGEAFSVSSVAGTQTELGNIPLRSAASMTDTDQDRLVDLAEFAVGTSATHPDTDTDGVTDAVEVGQCEDPLSGIVISPGLLSRVNLSGLTREVVAWDANRQALALAATGSFGLAILDVTDPQKPLVLNQLDLAGDSSDVAVDASLRVAVVAARSGGLLWIDVSDPARPALIRSVTGFATQVEIDGGVVYAGMGDKLIAYDVKTADPISSVTLSNTIVGLDHSGRNWVAADASKNLSVVTSDFGTLQVVGGRTLSATGPLFAADQTVYVAAESGFSGGYLTVDISVPSAPRVIGNVAATGLAGKRIVLNGSGMGVTVGSPGGLGNLLQTVDTTDPANTSAFLSQINLPADPESVSIVNGYALVADGDGGLVVVNYLSRDTAGIPPRIDLSNAIEDRVPTAAGIQVEAGKRLVVRPVITDDKQVQYAELILDGMVSQRVMSFPFEMSTLLAPGATSAVVQVRAVDMSGNQTMSNPLQLEIVRDRQAPTIKRITPSSETILYPGSRTIKVIFSEAMSDATFQAANFSLTPQAGGQPIRPASVSSKDLQRSVELVFALTGAGLYDFMIDGTAVQDAAGVPLGGSGVRSRFQVDPLRDPGNTLATALPLGLVETDYSYSDSLNSSFDGTDIYSFRLGETQSVTWKLSGQTSSLSLKLVRDLDGDGVVDTNEVYATDSGSGTVTDNQELAPGTYFVVVDIWNFGTATPYTLTVTPGTVVPLLSSDPGSSLVTTYDLTDLGTTRTVSDFLMSGVDNTDVYKFTLNTTRLVTVSMTGQNNNIQFKLVRDLDGDGVVDTNEVYATDSGSGTVTDNQELAPGTYFVVVDIWNYGTATPYTLTVTPGTVVPLLAPDPGSTLATAYNLIDLSTPRTAADFLMTGVDNTDIYKFALSTTRTVTIQLQHLNSSVRIDWVRDLDNDGTIDANEILKTGSGQGTLTYSWEITAGLNFFVLTILGSGTATPVTLNLTP